MAAAESVTCAKCNAPASVAVNGYRYCSSHNPRAAGSEMDPCVICGATAAKVQHNRPYCADMTHNHNNYTPPR